MSSDLAISAHHVSKVYELGLTGRTRSVGSILRERLRHPLRGGGSARERFHALDDVSFDIARGEVVGVIGRNGAGKSTLLKILSRITLPSQGHIDLDGTVGSLLEVGTGFHPELTGLENVYMYGTILGMSKRDIDRRLDEIIEFSGVERFLSTPVKRYSSGMRVRLAFSVAAHLDPEIMIIDEVLSVGDHAFQQKCVEKMRSLASDGGRTVLYVSHNLVSVEHLCPRTMLLVDGKVAFDGPTDEAVVRYLGTSSQHHTSEAPGVFDLEALERAQDTGHRIFTRLEIRPDGGEPAGVVRMGQRLRFDVSVEGLHEIADAVVLLTVGSGSTHRLFRLSSRMAAPDVRHPREERERFLMDIPALPLTPGEYHVSVSVYHGPEHVFVDRVQRAATFTVVGADVLGTGYQFGAQDGVVVVPFHCEIEPARRPVEAGLAES